MKTGVILETKRLILREWKASDREPFAKMNRDPKVMEFFPSVLSKEASDEFCDRVQRKMQEKGYGLWACSVKGQADFIGFIGINEIEFAAPFSPKLEIGWRLRSEYWGKGYATEGAKAVLRYAKETLGIAELVSFTAVINTRSIRVMEKIGLKRDMNGDFDHPKVKEGSPLRRHVLYRTETWG